MNLQEYLDTQTLEILRKRFDKNPSRMAVEGESLEDWWESLTLTEKIQLIFPQRNGTLVVYEGTLYKYGHLDFIEDEIWAFLSKYLDDFLIRTCLGNYMDAVDLKEVVMKKAGEGFLRDRYSGEHFGIIFVRWE